MSPPSHWIVTADHRRAAIYELTKTSVGTWHADERRAIESTHEDEHEHHRPSLLARGPRPNESGRAASWGHEIEEEQRRFARETASWLSGAIAQLSVGHVHVFAAPGSLGLLREEIARLTDHAHLAPHLTLHEGELAGLDVGELAKHPAIREALRAPEKAKPIVL